METYKIKDNCLEILNGAKTIENGAFSSQKLISVKIPTSVENIESYAFTHNELENIEIPCSVTNIGYQAFTCNNLTSLEIPESVKIIGDHCFSNNKLEKLEIQNGIDIIKNSVFAYNQLESVKIPESVTEIGNFAFSHNKLKNVLLSSNLKNIKNNAFSHNQLEDIEIPCSVEILETSAFMNNQLKNIIIPGSIKEIGHGAFSNNKLEQLEISNGVQYIAGQAFENNNLTSVEIPSSIKRIGHRAFFNNNLTSIEIPSTVEIIDTYAFDNIEIKYNNHIFSEHFVSSYGCENIIEASKILDISPSFNFESFSYSLIKIIPKDNDSVKGYINNYRIFNKLKEEINIEEFNNEHKEEYKDFYKMCYTLGLFNTGGDKQKEVMEVIKKICQKYTVSEIHEMYKYIELTKYKEKFSEIILKEYDHPDLMEIITNLYNNYEEISKSIIAGRKEKIGILNAEYKSSSSMEVKEKLENLKSLKKNIIMDDVIKYNAENIFEIREQNENLAYVAKILSSFMNQEKFDKIQDIYEKAKKVEKKEEKIYSYIIDENKEGFHYAWLSGDDPTNTVLGYLCDCCAKLGGTGEYIMIKSMTKHNIKNLVIYDSMKKIVGKSTAYYNREQKYIIFNNIEIKQKFLESKKTTANEKKEVLKTILRGIKDQIKSMQENGIEVKDVRIGMRNNDLEQEIKNEGIEIVYKDLLQNCHFGKYAGDANDEEKGQAIIKI